PGRNRVATSSGGPTGRRMMAKLRARTGGVKAASPRASGVGAKRRALTPSSTTAPGSRRVRVRVCALVVWGSRRWVWVRPCEATGLHVDDAEVQLHERHQPQPVVELAQTNVFAGE